MPWIVAAGMAVAAGVSYLSSKDSMSKQERAAQMQADAMDRQTKVAEDQLDWSKEQYGNWQERFDPIFGDMMESLDDDLTPNYAAIAGDVSSSFQSQRNQERRNLMRYGVRPQDGSFARADREYGIREATAHVGARSQAREATRGLKYNRLASVMGMGYGVQPNVISSVNNSANSVGNAYGNQSNMYGMQQQMYGNQAQQQAYGTANLIGNMDWAGMWNSTKGWWNARNSQGNGAAAGAFAGS